VLAFLLLTRLIPGASEGAAPEPTGPTPAGRGSSNLRDIWTIKDAPFEVRTAKRKRRYKTAQAATTAIREAAKTGQPVELVVRGEPVNLPTLGTASYADIYARIERAERVQAAERAEAESRRRLLQEREDEEALVLALARLWRL
jgi:hypothetical protein